MKKYRSTITFVILLAVQMVLMNYLNLSQYIVPSILPGMIIMLLPIGCRPVPAMVTAFVSALAVDLLCDGVPGLNALALVPVAFCRQGIIKIVFGTELTARKEDISVVRHGYGKVALSLLLSTALYMAIYVVADAAATRPAWFNLLRWALSTVVSTAAALLLSPLMGPDNRD